MRRNYCPKDVYNIIECSVSFWHEDLITFNALLILEEGYYKIEELHDYKSFPRLNELIK